MMRCDGELYVYPSLGGLQAACEDLTPGCGFRRYLGPATRGITFTEMVELEAQHIAHSRQEVAA